MSNQVEVVVNQATIPTVVEITAPGPQGPLGPSGSTDLSYDPATRLLSSSSGADVTLPLADATNAGLLTAAEKALIASALQAGQAFPSIVDIRNNSGTELTIGTPVYVTGSSGIKPTATAADASLEPTAARTLGLMWATAAHNSDGKVLTRGILSGVNTSALTEGAAIWLSETTGQLTTTRPTQPAHGVFLGFCIRQGPGSSGILYVNVINGQELNELHDVLITGSPPAEGAPRPALVLSSDGIWRNIVLSPTDVGAATAAQGTDARTPTAHAASHGSGGADAITVAQSQVTGLATALAGKETAGAAATAIAAHEAALDPHPGYLTPAEANAAYATAATVTTSAAGLQPATGFGTITYASSVSLDLSTLDGQVNTITLTGSLELTTSNLANGRRTGLRLIPGASSRTLTFPTDWVFVSAKPASLPANKTARLSIECYGTANSNVIAAIAIQP